MTSLIGMLLSLLVCSMALVISSADQTGQQVTLLTLAFQNSISEHGISGHGITEHGITEHGTGQRQRSVDCDRLLSFREPEVQDHRAVHSVEGTARKPLSSRTTDSPSDATELGPLVDVRRPVFLNLLSELQRFSSVSAVNTFEGELAIDLLWSAAVSDEEIVGGICDVIRSVENRSDGVGCEYQLTVWATSPVRPAFLDAALRASRLQSQVQDQHQASRSSASIRLSSSGQIWGFRKAIRPTVTIVIRRVSS